MNDTMAALSLDYYVFTPKVTGTTQINNSDNHNFLANNVVIVTIEIFKKICRRTNMILKLMGVFLLLLCLSACSDDLQGKVIRIADGDTITILDKTNAQQIIRLQGIDAPEKGQAYGNVSRQHLVTLIAGKNVRVAWKSRDRYQRILGTVYLNEKDMNLEMLKVGLAWHYKKYDSNPVYAKAEADARSNKLGLWRDPNPINPDRFRKVKTAKKENMKTPPKRSQNLTMNAGTKYEVPNGRQWSLPERNSLKADGESAGGKNDRLTGSNDNSTSPQQMKRRNYELFSRSE